MYRTYQTETNIFLQISSIVFYNQPMSVPVSAENNLFLFDYLHKTT